MCRLDGEDSLKGRGKVRRRLPPAGAEASRSGVESNPYRRRGPTPTGAARTQYSQGPYRVWCSSAPPNALGHGISTSEWSKGTCGQRFRRKPRIVNTQMARRRPLGCQRQKQTASIFLNHCPGFSFPQNPIPYPVSRIYGHSK